MILSDFYICEEDQKYYWPNHMAPNVAVHAIYRVEGAREARDADGDGLIWRRLGGVGCGQHQQEAHVSRRRRALS